MEKREERGKGRGGEGRGEGRGEGVLHVNPLSACIPSCQKRDHILDVCELSCGCWKLNSRFLKEQPVLLTAWLIFLRNKVPEPAAHQLVVKV